MQNQFFGGGFFSSDIRIFGSNVIVRFHLTPLGYANLMVLTLAIYHRGLLRCWNLLIFGWHFLFRNGILLVWTLPYWWGNCDEDKNQMETEKGYCCNCEAFTQFCCSDYFYENYPSSTQIIFLRIFFLRIAKAPFYKS